MGFAGGPSGILGDLDVVVQFELTEETGTEVGTVCIEKDTLVVRVVDRETDLDLILIVAQGSRMALERRSAEHLIHPVCPGLGDPGVHVRIPSVRDREPRPLVGIDPHLQLFLSSQRGEQVICLMHTVSTVIRDGYSLLGGTLRGHQDDSTGTRLGAIDSGRGGVFENHDGLNLVHGERCAWDTVHNPKDRLSAPGSLSADHNTRCGSRGATICCNRNSGDLSLKHS